MKIMKYVRFLVFTAMLIISTVIKAQNIPTWKHIGGGMGGNTFWMTIDPSDDQTMYWCPDMGGAFKTIDGGKSWKSIGAEFLHEHRGNGMSLLTVAASNSKIIYAYFQMRIADLDKSSPLVKKFGDRHIGLMQSQDGGDTWRGIKAPVHRLGAIAIDPSNTDTVWALGPGFYAASAGVTFKKIYHAPGAGALAMTTDNWKTSQIAYVACKDGADGKAKRVAFGGMVVDPASAFGNRTLYVCGNMGVVKSTDNGKTWNLINEGLTNKDVQKIALHRDAKTNNLVIYVTVRGKSRGGVFKSIDGRTWKSVTNNLPIKTNMGCRNVVIDNRDANVAYVGMSYKNGRDNGLFKTVDGGQSWLRVTHPVGEKKNKDTENCWNETAKDRVEGLIISKQNPDVLVFADGNCRMFKSMDGGKQWKQCYTDNLGDNRFRTRGMEDTCSMDVLVSPYDKDRVYIAEHDFSGMSSFDGGETFYSAAKAIGGRSGWTTFAIDTKDHNVVFGNSKYIRGSGARNGIFYTSLDGGKTWDRGQGAPGADRVPASIKDSKYKMALINTYTSSIVTLNDSRSISRVVIAKKTGVFYSDDRGKSWTVAKTPIDPDDDFAIFRLYKSKANPKRLYAVAGLMPAMCRFVEYGRLNMFTNREVTNFKGGLYRSDDEGESWKRIDKSVPAANASALAFDPKDENIMYISTLSWYDKHGIASTLKSPGGLYRSEDGGVTWKMIFASKKRIYAGVRDIAINKNGTIYAVGQEFTGSDAQAGIYKTKDRGKTWHDITGKAALQRYTRIVVDPFNHQRLYVGTYGAGSLVGIDIDE